MEELQRGAALSSSLGTGRCRANGTSPDTGEGLRGEPDTWIFNSFHILDLRLQLLLALIFIFGALLLRH